MNPTWYKADPPDLPNPRPWQKLRMVLRAATLVFVTYFGMVFVLLFNLVERFVPLGISIRIIRLWGRICLWLCGLRVNAIGRPMEQHGAIVSNHVGWVDIFTLLTAARVYFVSKAEVSSWPVVGILSRQIGTLYIERRRSAAKRQEAQMFERLDRGDRLCFFPEGTSTDGQRVLDFKSTLFSAFLSPDHRESLWIQPVTLVYRPADGLPSEFYSWWGDMALGGHLQAVLALSRGGVVDVIFHDPLHVADYPDRKALARACEAKVRDGLDRSAQG